MKEFTFSTVGAATEVNHKYLVTFVKGDDAIARYTLETPLTWCELHQFILSRLKRTGSIYDEYGIDVSIVSMSTDEEFPRIGLSGLEYLISGKGVQPKNVMVKFQGKTYNVSVDKYVKFLESLK